ncbi:MAG: thioredoxin family protein [Flavobacteriia bacterium]|nr:thioredoxin family protein [Flavobacteriia bacterium]
MEEIRNLIYGDRPVLIDFYTDDCGPCKLLNQVLDELKAEVGDGIEIIRVDIDKEKLTTINFDSTYQIMGTPTMLLFKEGKLVWRYSGVLFKDDLLDRISPFVYETNNV